MITTENTPSPISASVLQRLADAELSVRSRLGHVALLLVALMMTSVIGALWLTEPALPRHTQLAFGMMMVIGLSWAAFALWVLTHRRVLLARHSIVAGRMAVTFTALFLMGALAVGYETGGRTPYTAALLGVVMLGGAVAMLARAHRTFARLTARRRALEVALREEEAG
jgi:hypothetical protein